MTDAKREAQSRGMNSQPDSEAKPEMNPKIDSEECGSRRDPEERPAPDKEALREKNLDKTLADSFPTSDPPSSIPDPAEDDSEAA